VRRLALAALCAVALAGCGSGTRTSGHATVWVTRDRGSVVLHVADVPAGLNAMQALGRVAEIGTRYGGRYVRSVDGVDEHGRRAWFYYVNGYLADRSAAEYRLRPGDVEWWDFRPWRDPAQDPVVVGSFPEPFLHGYDGERRRAVVAALDPGNRLVRTVARRLHARAVLATGKIPREANVLFLAGALTGSTRFEARLRTTGAPPGSPVRMLYLGDMRRLARRRWPYRFHYAVRS
jgi:Domain of unknown function (DUF4430)